jgi:hypothetical protein
VAQGVGPEFKPRYQKKKKNADANQLNLKLARVGVWLSGRALNIAHTPQKNLLKIAS